MRTNPMKQNTIATALSREIRIEGDWLEIVEGSLKLIGISGHRWWQFRVPTLDVFTAVPMDRVEAIRWNETDEDDPIMISE